MVLLRIAFAITLILVSERAMGDACSTEKRQKLQAIFNVVPEDKERATFNNIQEYYQFLFGKGGFDRELSFEENVLAAKIPEPPPTPVEKRKILGVSFGAKKAPPKPEPIVSWILAHDTKPSIEEIVETARSMKGGFADPMVSKEMDTLLRDGYSRYKTRFSVETKNGIPSVEIETASPNSTLKHKVVLQANQEGFGFSETYKGEIGYGSPTRNFEETASVRDQDAKTVIYRLAAAKHFEAISAAQEQQVIESLKQWVKLDLNQAKVIKEVNPFDISEKALNEWEWSFQGHAVPKSSLIYLPNGATAKEGYSLAIHLKGSEFVMLETGEKVNLTGTNPFQHAPGPPDPSLVEKNLKDSLRKLGIDRPIDPATDYPIFLQESMSKVESKLDRFNHAYRRASGEFHLIHGHDPGTAAENEEYHQLFKKYASYYDAGKPKLEFSVVPVDPSSPAGLVAGTDSAGSTEVFDNVRPGGSGSPMVKSESGAPTGSKKAPTLPPVSEEQKIAISAPAHSPALQELKGMDGMEKVAEQLGSLREFLAVAKTREKEGLKNIKPMLHARFDGNPGTGKTTVARIYGDMVRELGLLKGAKPGALPLVERAGVDFSGPDALEKMKEAIKEAQGGVLLMDELYSAEVEKNSNARDAITYLMKEMEDKRENFIVVGTGYSDKMDEFISSNDGFTSRFPQKVNFEDYDDATLGKIMKKMAKDSDYVVDDKTVDSVIQKISRERGRGFGNARRVRNEFEAAARRQGNRLAAEPTATRTELKTILLDDFEASQRSIEAKLNKLDQMIGLDDVKQNMRSVVSMLNLEKNEAEHGMVSTRPLLNVVFSGNTGTGKTTVAKMYGELLKEMGYVSKGEFIYVKAGDLIGDAIGVSESKTKALMKRAKGNVLFIDELPRLYEADSKAGNSYGKAVLDTLVDGIDPDVNQDMVVILGGYEAKMTYALGANEGLARRFPKTFHFPDYNQEQLGQILLKKAKERGITISPEAHKAALAELNVRRSAKGFGNAGEVENLLGSARLRRSERLAASGKTAFTRAEMEEYRPEDFVEPRRSPEEILNGLDSLPGLTEVKRTLREMKETHEEAALADLSPHDVFGGIYSFEGHAPTEQRKVAQSLGELLHSQGIIPKANIIEVSGNDLRGQYLGDSAQKTTNALDRALGHTLYLNDLGSISNPHNTYEKEVQDTLTHFLKTNQGKIAVVLAGTPEEVERFMAANPKIAGKIEHRIEFKNLSVAEGKEYVHRLLGTNGKSLDDSAQDKLNEVMAKLVVDSEWGNAKGLEDFKKRVLIKQAVRVKRVPGADVNLIEASDIEAATPAGLLRAPAQSHLPEVSKSNASPEVFVDTGRTRTLELEATPENTHAVHHEAPAKKETHAHAHDELAEEGIEISDSTRKIMLGIDGLMDKNNPSNNLLLKNAIRDGKLDLPLLEKLARNLGMSLDEASLARLDESTRKAILEMKAQATKLKELAKTQTKAKKLVKNYVCLACGRTTCNYMPYTWFTEEEI